MYPTAGHQRTVGFWILASCCSIRLTTHSSAGADHGVDVAGHHAGAVCTLASGVPHPHQRVVRRGRLRLCVGRAAARRAANVRRDAVVSCRAIASLHIGNADMRRCSTGPVPFSRCLVMAVFQDAGCHEMYLQRRTAHDWRPAICVLCRPHY